MDLPAKAQEFYNAFIALNRKMEREDVPLSEMDADVEAFSEKIDVADEFLVETAKAIEAVADVRIRQALQALWACLTLAFATSGTLSALGAIQTAKAFEEMLRGLGAGLSERLNTGADPK